MAIRARQPRVEVTDLNLNKVPDRNKVPGGNHPSGPAPNRSKVLERSRKAAALLLMAHQQHLKAPAALEAPRAARLETRALQGEEPVGTNNSLVYKEVALLHPRPPVSAVITPSAGAKSYGATFLSHFRSFG